MPLPAAELATRARRLRLLLFDVDGTLTDGSVFIGSDGFEAKAFSIRDGAALIWAQRSGLDVGVLSGRPSPATTRRAQELRMSVILQGGPDKREMFARLLVERGLAADEIAFMGGDLLDLPILAQAGLSAAPADAAAEVRSVVHWISQAPGGHGAVREFIEAVLRARGHWEALVASHLSGPRENG
jgi:3-deoxy-D-manno-octulosonate 8-phosphate phosphatase (KDO 8-P phosphatase)